MFIDTTDARKPCAVHSCGGDNIHMRLLPVVILAANVAAQPAQSPKFDVATIKPAAPGAFGSYVRPMPGGHASIVNMTLKMLVQIAYGVQAFQVTGGPAWADAIHYDVEAKPDTPGKPSDVRPMLQALLADRFRLVVHRETKELPVYALVLARKDGNLGPGMKESKEGGCTPGEPGRVPTPVGPGIRPTCGAVLMGPGVLTGVSVEPSKMVPALSRILGRTVIDKTGLSTKYDIKLEYTPDENHLAMLPPPEGPPTADSSGPSLLTALREQLGLKLESQRGPVQILVIDRAEKPSEN